MNTLELINKLIKDNSDRVIDQHLQTIRASAERDMRWLPIAEMPEELKDGRALWLTSARKDGKGRQYVRGFYDGQGWNGDYATGYPITHYAEIKAPGVEG